MLKISRTITGLMVFMFYSAGGNLSITLMVCSALGIAFLATGISAFHTFFIVCTIIMPPYVIITGIAGGYASKYASKWERFQLTMPVRRNDVTFSQYLCIIIVSAIGIPIIGVVVGVGIALHESLSEIAPQVMSSTVSTFTISFGLALLLAALYFPLTCTKIGENKGESLAFVCLLAALGIIGLIAWAGYSMNMSHYAESLLRLAVSVIPFILSYHLTKRLYAKIDL